MEYWRGYMNWPLDPAWACETCGDCTLVWGLPHGVCRCTTCHTQYAMRTDGERVKTPISRLKPEYKQPAAWGWARWESPISEWTDEMWDEAFAATKVEFVDVEPESAT